MMKELFLILFILLNIFCSGQNLSKTKTNDSINNTTSKDGAVKNPTVLTSLYGPLSAPALQISQYIRRMHEDQFGNIWFGTNGDGVARLTSNSLEYLFNGGAVRGVVEEKELPAGKVRMWFATSLGLSHYEAQLDEKLGIDKKTEKFSTFSAMGCTQLWCIMKNKNTTGGALDLWIGTEDGLVRYNGETFTAFPLPVPDLSNFPNAYNAPKLVNCLMQDKKGNIWMGTNGNGVYCYDGENLINYKEQDGLCNNFVQCILEDRTAEKDSIRIWFGTRFGGMSRFDGHYLSEGKKAAIKQKPAGSFTNYTINEGLSTNFVWTFMQDKGGELWIGTAGGGFCRFLRAGKESTTGAAAKGERVGNFARYGSNEGVINKHVQSLLEDQKGNLWIGTSGGAFRYDKDESKSTAPGKFINVKRSGPW